MDPTIALRLAELDRRVNALPAELDQWKKRTEHELEADAERAGETNTPDANLYNANFSQVQAIDGLLRLAIEAQRKKLERLATAPSAAAFAEAAWKLIEKVIESQRVWDYFRDKLNLRLVPGLRDGLWLADTVAWDCYRPVLNEAVKFQVLRNDELREPPLTYLIAEFSPYTYARGDRPEHDGRRNALGPDRLPIPVIGFPWDHLPNPWELVYIAHEAAHDLEVDLKLKAPLADALVSELTRPDGQTGEVVPPERVACWKAWQREVFADLVALRQVGPAYTDGLAHILLLPAAQVVSRPAVGLYPPHFLRILMNVAYIRKLVPDNPQLNQHADRLGTMWVGVYNTQPQLDPFVTDFPRVFRALMDSPTDALKGKTVAELLPFTAANDASIRLIANYLWTGNNPPGPVSPRFCVAAARLAANDAATQGADKLTETLAKIGERTAQLVRKSAPGGKRSGGAGEARRLAVYGRLLGLVEDDPPG